MYTLAMNLVLLCHVTVVRVLSYNRVRLKSIFCILSSCKKEPDAHMWCYGHR